VYDNGSAWSAMKYKLSNNLWGVWGSSASDVFAVGSGGTILHYNGSAWNGMTTGTTSGLRGVWGSSASDVFAVGYDVSTGNGLFLHCNGSAWSPMSSSTAFYYLGNDWGQTLHYNGSTWSLMSSGTVHYFYGVWGSSPSDVFVVGGGGTILHYPEATQSSNQHPNRPTSTAPAAGTTGVSLTPTLQSSTSSNPDAGDTLAASQWQIRTSSGSYSNPVFDSSTDPSHLTSITLPSLTHSTTYYWRVRYQDNHGTWSVFSSETSFTTNSMPEQPANVQPTEGQAKVGRTPTLQGSPFADADAGEGHLASQWRVTSVAGNYSSPVWDSGVDESNLTQMTIPAGTLEYDTSYYWQVRYQDSQGSWSSWSAETGFGTGAAPSPPAALLIAAAVVGVVAMVAMTAPLMLPM